MKKSVYSCGLPQMLIVSMWTWFGISVTQNTGVSANFNFYLDRREFQKLHGISSDIYYVREGVVNAYATSFLVTVPAEVDDLNFSWQALTKRHVLYEMSIDYTDVFALLPPFFNISNTGRVPQNLEVFRLTLPCSGRSNAEVGVTIRIVFQIKYPKINTTTINIKRNKICLLKDNLPSKATIATSPGHQFVTNHTDLQSIQLRNQSIQKAGSSGNSGTDPKFLVDLLQILLLCGILAGCAVTASGVVLTFFICIRQKLAPLDVSRNSLPAINGFHHETDPHSSYNSSPACLVRQCESTAQSNGITNQSWTKFSSGNISNGTEKCAVDPTIPENQKSYSTIGSFWRDILYPSSNPTLNVHVSRHSQKALHDSRTKHSDVSPYAYAQVGLQQPQPPPLPKSGAPPFIEWYSDSPRTSNNSLGTTSSRAGEDAHIYANGLHTTFCSKKNGRNTGEYKTESFAPNTSTIKSTTGSLIQIDGFQCRRNLTQEANVVERFL